MIQDGNMINMPALTAEDMNRAIDMFGEPVGSVRGKMTQKPMSGAIYDND